MCTDLMTDCMQSFYCLVHDSHMGTCITCDTPACPLQVAHVDSQPPVCIFQVVVCKCLLHHFICTTAHQALQTGRILNMGQVRKAPGGRWANGLGWQHAGQQISTLHNLSLTLFLPHDFPQPDAQHAIHLQHGFGKFHSQLRRQRRADKN